ncbi:MAG: four helix bundle protein [Anaerolineales bacterium]
MNYENWVAELPDEFKSDPLWHVEAYRLALLIADIAWYDATKLIQDIRTKGLADQLYRATGSISANLSEGYSRKSGKDQARFYEYAQGSAREAKGWYYQGRHILTSEVSHHRIKLLTSIIKLTSKMIPNKRGYKISEEQAEYRTIELNSLLSNIPLP